ncbi:MAG: hypothetical protein VKJ64_00275, partial [Leptolyngbyaceae bacterium]|nr:hypothetical protein [Leptolyngbyaceae bacterium]
MVGQRRTANLSLIYNRRGTIYGKQRRRVTHLNAFDFWLKGLEPTSTSFLSDRHYPYQRYFIMKSIINMGLSLAFLIAAGWIVKDVILKADANP